MDTFSQIQNDPSLFYTRNEVRQLFKVSDKTVINWEKAGRITGYTMAGKLIRYSKSDVLNLIQRVER